MCTGNIKIRRYLLFKQHFDTTFSSNINIFYSRSASLCNNTLCLPTYNMPAQSAPGSRRGSTTLYNTSLLAPISQSDVNGKR